MKTDKTFNTLLFDLEGTLVDFQWRLDDAVGETLDILSRAGIDPARYGVSPSYAGLYNTTRDMVKNREINMGDRLFAQLDAVYDRYDQDALSRWSPYGDTHPLLVTLSTSGFRMAVVSNCGAHAADTVLRKFNLAGFFEVVVSRDDVDYLKPHPNGLILSLEKLQVSAEKTLFIGDSLNDILAANRILMPSCFLFGGESRVTKETADTATFQIPSLSRLIEYLA